MRACALPLLTLLECRLAAAFHVPPRVTRRWPLALALLRCNYADQAAGMETWWPAERATDAEVDAKLAAARAAALTPGNAQTPARGEKSPAGCGLEG